MFCAQFSFDLVTVTFDLLTLAVSDELSFIHPTHVPIFSTLQLSIAELWVTQCDHITITWNGHCACKVPDRIQYKVISVTYKLLQSSAPHYLRDLITIQSARSARSSSLVTLVHPPVQSNLKITKRSFRHAAPHLWNKLPPSLRIQSTGSIPSFSDSHHGPVCHLSNGAFHSRLKTHLFFKSFPP